MKNFYVNALPWGQNILFRGFEDGKRVTKKVPFKPTLYVRGKTASKWKSLSGVSVEPMKFESIKEAKDFIKRYEEVEGFPIFGMNQWQYQFLSEEYFNQDIEYDLTKFNIKTLDIECSVTSGFPNIETASEEVLLISIRDKITKELIVFGTRDYNKSKEDNFSFRLFANETAMLKAFIDYWAGNYPDIVTGWNVDQFDFPYLINRINRVLDEEWVKRLSPWGFINERRITIRGKEVQTYDILGVVILDYMDLYKKFTFGARESYSLDFILKFENIKVNKISYDGSYRDFYTNDWDLFVQYNARDSEGVDELDEKLKFIELCITIAYIAKCNFKDVYGQVRLWDVFIYNYLAAKNIAIPAPKHSIGGSIEGAYVKDPQMGMRGWTVSFDFASLYPTIMQQWNLSPETISNVQVKMDPKTLVSPPDYEKMDPSQMLYENPLDWQRYIYENDVTMAANGTLYSKKKKGILAEVVEVMVTGRKTVKKEMIRLKKLKENAKSELERRNLSRGNKS